MADLDRAIAGLREAVSQSKKATYGEDDKWAELERKAERVLAALDAARGEAVWQRASTIVEGAWIDATAEDAKRYEDDGYPARCLYAAPPAALAVPDVDKLEADILKVIEERDEREEVINDILDLVLGKDREEWSSAYDFRDAVNDVDERMAVLLAQQPAAAVPAGYVPLAAFIEAREQVENWGAYAAPYFQDKWDLAGTLAKMDEQIAAARKGE